MPERAADAGDQKIALVLGEFKRKRLHSGRSGTIVKSRKQALAIAVSEGRKARRRMKDGT